MEVVRRNFILGALFIVVNFTEVLVAPSVACRAGFRIGGLQTSEVPRPQRVHSADLEVSGAYRLPMS